MKILVTGATGYIGSVLVRMAIVRGHTVVAASRRQPPARCEWLPYELGNALEIPADVDAIVHLAADTAGASTIRDIELHAATALMTGIAGHMRFVYVSSQTSRPDAPTKYGRDKWAVEQYVLSHGGWVARPGQVYGGEERGLFGTLAALVRRLPVLPAFVPVPYVQPIHVQDCAEGILRMVEHGHPDHRVFHLASASPVSFTRFLRGIARHRLDRRTVFVPVPAIIIRTLSGASRHLGIALPAIERIRSLLDIPRVASARDISALGLRLRLLEDGMSRSGTTRRRLIEEGRALLSYVLRRAPAQSLLAHYVRSVELIESKVALGLPHWMTTWPCLVALIDAPSILARNEDLKWRLDVATVIAEASAPGFNRFMRAGRNVMKVRAFFGIVHAGAIEALWRVTRLAAAPMVARLARDLKEPKNV